MDTSRSYVKMCRYAQYLQALWEPKQDDWWHVGARDVFAQIKKTVINGEEKWMDFERNYFLPRDINLYGIVWLPRVDQLQEMLKYLSEEKKPKKSINNKIKNFCSAYETDKNLSDEKMWLMYYMAKKFKKVWKEGRLMSDN